MSNIIEFMIQSQIKILKNALSILKKEFNNKSCEKDRCATCVGCWGSIAIIQLEAIINIADGDLWKYGSLENN